MESYQFFDTVVLRTPAFCYDAYAGMDWPSLLNDLSYLDAIRRASPVVYEELRKLEFSADRLTPKLRRTLLRYYNRMCFRPTPFATMASLSITHFGNDEEPVILEDNWQVHCGPDFKSILAVYYATEEVSDTRFFVTNETIYDVGGQWRYISFATADDIKKRNFQIVSITKTDAIAAVIDACKEPMAVKEIISVITKTFNAKEDDCGAFISSLIERQVLLATDMPRVSGYTSISGNDSEHASVSDRSYIITERTAAAGSVPIHFQGKLLEALAVGNKLTASSKHPGLETFKQVFRKKFDMQVVPLMQALDPEVGIGYQELAAAVTQDSMLKDVLEIKKPTNSQTIEWTPAHSYLFSKWAEACDKGTLQIEEDEIESLSTLKINEQLPPSFSVMGRICDQQFFIEHAGGCSALPLLGRFTILGTSYADFACRIARKEAETNPEVIFAEIVHYSETHTANIERRSAIREFEIPIITGSGVNREAQIPLSDLVIKLENDTILLWSVKHQRRIIPRLSSAFNYQRSDLSVFRFLCDLQHQDIKANFCPSLQQFFPGQSYYPRLQYKQVIFQLATWILSARDKERVLADKKYGELENISHWLIAHKCPRYLCVSEHDNQIVIDTDDRNGLDMLLEFFKQKKTITLTEYPYADQETALVQNASGDGYISQVVCSLYNTQAVYNAPKGQVVQTGGQVARTLMPGSEWLYFKIYCLPMRANELLTQHLAPLIKKLQDERLVKSYFFMRFTDDGFHIRLRFLLCETPQAGGVLQQTNHVFDKLREIGSISKIQIDTYERELERYSEELIEDVEAFFRHSSDAILHYIGDVYGDTTDLSYYRVGFAGVQMIYDAFALTPHERIRVSEFFYKAFSKEYNHDPAIEQKARDVFRQIGLTIGFETILSAENVLPGAIISGMTTSLDKINSRKHLLNAKRINQLIGSLIHLHLNRLFTDQARMQEMIVYYCLWKYYESLVARANRAACHISQETGLT